MRKADKVTEILNRDSRSRRTTLLGTVDGCNAIYVVSLDPLKDEDAEKAVAEPGAAFDRTRCVQANGKYQQYACEARTSSEPLLGLRATVDVVCPATKKDIAKYRRTKEHVYRETAEMYREHTLRAIEAIPESETEWVRSIVDRDGKESATAGEEILYEDDDMVLLRDTKWPAGAGAVPEELYCLGIVKMRHSHIRCVRDLRGDDADWLERSVAGCTEYIAGKFGVARRDLRVFVHYIPSFFHFHVHFIHVASSQSHNAMSPRAIFVEDIVDNLRRDPEYYRTCSLSVLVHEGTSFDAIFSEMC